MTSTSPTAQLQRGVGARQFFTLAFGSIIGVAWVVVLGTWLDIAGPLGAVLGFALGGALMLLIGLCYAELMTTLPAAGGEVV